MDAHLSSDKLVGGYRVEHRLGEGGMGTVYAAVEPTIGKRVAIKVLRRDLAFDESFSQRFEREAKSAAQIHHPNVIEIFAYGKLEDGRPYFVMPLLSGQSLRQALDRDRRILPGEAWRIAREIAAGLEAAHALGVLHRDLKPDNVFLVEHAGRPARPVLLDFGLAKIAEGSEADDGSALAKLTGTGVPIGTPLYMAPEQWWQAPATVATDQYGLGGVLFEMLAGRPPFEGTKYPELLEAHLHKPPPSLREIGVEVPAAVDTFIARLLAKEASDRFDSMTSLIAAGDSAFGVESAAPSRPLPVSEAALAKTELGPPPSLGAVAPRLPVARYAIVSLLVMLVLPAAGYPGAIGRNVLEWLNSIGFGFAPIVVASLASLVLLPACVRRAITQPVYGLVSLALTVTPAALAFVPVYMGWNMVVSHLPAAGPAAAFEVLHWGYYEVNVARFLGLGLTAGHAAGLAVLLGSVLAEPRAAAPRRAGVAYAVAGLALASALALLVVGWVSPALVLVAAAVRLGITNWVPPTTTARLPLVIDRVLASTVATLALVGVAFTRSEVSLATPFMSAVPRSERVTQLMFATQQQDASLGFVFAAAALLGVGAWASHGGRVFDPAATRAARARLPVSGLIAIGVILLLTAVDVWVRRDFDARRSAIVDQMKEQLVFFAKLVPPGAPPDRDLPAPTPAVALQVSLEAVALNGKALGRLTALESEAGRQTILRELTAALASPTPGGEGSGIDVSLLVDRRVPMKRVEELGALAYEAGARTAEVLLTRGPLAEVPANAPREAGLLLPQDFVGVRVSLETSRAATGEEGTFESFASALHDRPAGEPIAIAVRRP